MCAGLESMCSVLRSGVACYKLALTSHPSPEQEASLRRRLGNVHNELGVLYMSQANGKSAVTCCVRLDLDGVCNEAYCFECSLVDQVTHGITEKIKIEIISENNEFIDVLTLDLWTKK